MNGEHPGRIASAEVPEVEAIPDAPSPEPAVWGLRRRRVRSSLLAAGEPMVWLTGGMLAICTAMVVGFLLLVLGQGLSTFWPLPVERVTTPDERVYMGEITRREEFRPAAAVVGDLPPAMREPARAELAASEGVAVRELFRTGNYRLTQNHFAWVSSFEIAARERPAWATVLERLEWGRFYGFPEAFVLFRTPEAVRTDVGELDQLTAVAEVSTGPEAAWRAFREHHDEVRERWRERRELEEHAVGAVNRVQERARLELRQAELELERVDAGSGRDSAAYAEARAAVERARAVYDEKRAWADGEFARIREEIERINDENRRYQLVMRTAGEGETAPQRVLVQLDDVVRGYRANQLGPGGKVGVYLSRWWEFLSDEPREANSEGGVFPAIFGTVAMTLIMSLAVVPFGVLAALYLREYARAGAVVSAVRIAVNNLAGVPSIVFGVFGLGFFCYVVGASIDELLFAAHLPNPTYGKGGLMWASLTLALLTLPVVIVATEEAVAAVPSSMREGSYACGASKWQTIRRIVLPRAMPGIITGMVLAIARGAGEVAPLMLVGAVKLAPELPIDGVFPYIHPERSFMHLGFHIYDVGFQSQNSEAAKPVVFTTTLLLISIIALLNLFTIWLRGRLRRRYAGSQF